MPIADRLAEELYNKRSEMFIQKHYNDLFPLVSLVEDKSKQKYNKWVFAYSNKFLLYAINIHCFSKKKLDEEELCDFWIRC